MPNDRAIDIDTLLDFEIAEFLMESGLMNRFTEQLNFADRVVLLTGATGHLGREFAATFAELGANLTLVDRDPLLLESLAEELWGSWKTETKVVPTNLEDEFERNELIKSCMSDGAVDILINNAAFVGSSELDGWSVPFEEQECWRVLLK